MLSTATAPIANSVLALALSYKIVYKHFPVINTNHGEFCDFSHITEQSTTSREKTGERRLDGICSSITTPNWARQSLGGRLGFGEREMRELDGIERGEDGKRWGGGRRCRRSRLEKEGARTGSSTTWTAASSPPTS
jgi:hypothetical protein